jgi:hypothetical protein
MAIEFIDFSSLSQQAWKGGVEVFQEGVLQLRNGLRKVVTSSDSRWVILGVTAVGVFTSAIVCLKCKECFIEWWEHRKKHIQAQLHLHMVNSKIITVLSRNSTSKKIEEGKYHRITKSIGEELVDEFITKNKGFSLDFVEENAGINFVVSGELTDEYFLLLIGNILSHVNAATGRRSFEGILTKITFRDTKNLTGNIIERLPKSITSLAFEGVETKISTDFLKRHSKGKTLEHLREIDFTGSGQDINNEVFKEWLANKNEIVYVRKERVELLPVDTFSSQNTEFTGKVRSFFKSYANSTNKKEVIDGYKRQFQDIYAANSKAFLSVFTIELTGTGVNKESFEALLPFLVKCRNLQEITFYDCPDVGDEVCKLLSSFSYWKGLVFKGCELIGDNSLLSLKKLECLEKLWLEKCPKVTQKGFVSFPTGACKNPLKSLVLSSMQALSSSDICSFILASPNIKELVIEKCKEVNNADGALFRAIQGLKDLRKLKVIGVVGLDFIEEFCPELEELEVSRSFNSSDSSNDGLSDDGCYKISSSHPHLRKVVISSCSKVGDLGVSAILRALTNLRELNIKNCLKVTQKAFEYIPTPLKRLRITHCVGIDNEILPKLSERGDSFTELRISGNNRLNSDEIISTLLPTLKNIEELDLSGFKMSRKAFNELHNKGSLRYLGLVNCGLTDSMTNLLYSTSIAFSGLQEVDLSKNPNLTEDSLISICSRAFRVLIMRDMAQVNMSLFDSLLKTPFAKSIEYLDLSSCENLNKATLSKIGQFLNLKTLILQKSKIKDADLSVFEKDFRSLNKLNLKGCSSLTLSAIEILDKRRPLLAVL